MCIRFSVYYCCCCGTSALTSSRPGLFRCEMGLCYVWWKVWSFWSIWYVFGLMRCDTGRIGKFWSCTDRCINNGRGLGLGNYSRAVTSCANFVRFNWTGSLVDDDDEESTCLLLQVSTRSSLEMLRTTVEEWQKAA
jgi:hypothetical protein